MNMDTGEAFLRLERADMRTCIYQSAMLMVVQGYTLRGRPTPPIRVLWSPKILLTTMNLLMVRNREMLELA